MRPTLPLAFALLHAADQIALAALPLVATLALGGGPALAGALVAAQGAAWLVVALPAGVLVDRADRRGLMALAGGAAALGFLLAAPLAGQPLLLGLLAFAGAGGVVVGALAAFALVPSLAGREALPLANARLELGRALATLAAAPVAGALAGAGAAPAALALAGVAGMAAAAVALALPAVPALPAAPRLPMRVAVVEGARFVLGHPLLRAIAGCAIAWNSAFFALMAVAVPLALGPLGLTPAAAGLALGGYGAGLVAGALAAPSLARRIPPGVLLVFGPALSLLGVLLPLLLPSFAGLLLCMAALGFGPMIWQVAQTSLRQAVTPAALLGRVGATLQVAVFGVRPLGALAGGALAGALGPMAALGLAAVGFGVSLLVVLRSPLPRLAALPAG